MFIGIFQYLPYQTGDENISIDAGLISTNNNNLNTNYLSRNLLKITNYLGQSVRPTSNTPLFFIYDDGKVEKRVILE